MTLLWAKCSQMNKIIINTWLLSELNNVTLFILHSNKHCNIIFCQSVIFINCCIRMKTETAAAGKQFIWLYLRFYDLKTFEQFINRFVFYILNLNFTSLFLMKWLIWIKSHVYKVRIIFHVLFICFVLPEEKHPDVSLSEGFCRNRTKLSIITADSESVWTFIISQWII